MGTDSIVFFRTTQPLPLSLSVVWNLCPLDSAARGDASGKCPSLEGELDQQHEKARTAHTLVVAVAPVSELLTAKYRGVCLSSSMSLAAIGGTKIERGSTV
jgi:hypothetical protein